MKKDIYKLSEEINNYLAEFKNEQGEKPNTVHIGLLVHNYCELFIENCNNKEQEFFDFQTHEYSQFIIFQRLRENRNLKF